MTIQPVSAILGDIANEILDSVGVFLPDELLPTVGVCLSPARVVRIHTDNGSYLFTLKTDSTGRVSILKNGFGKRLGPISVEMLFNLMEANTK